MIDAIASEYADRVTFVAIAGRSSEPASRARAGVWFDPQRILWGYDDDLWGRYAVRSQPRTFLISSDDVIVGGWFGRLPEADLRAELDRLAGIG